MRESLQDAQNITEFNQSYFISANDPFLSLKGDYNVKSRGSGAECIYEILLKIPTE